MKNALGSVS